MNKLALEGFLQRVEGMSVPDLKVIRTEFSRRIARGERFLGDGDTDLVAVGALDRLIAEREQDQAEDGLTLDQIYAADVTRLQKLVPGVGQKIAERYLKGGSPWETAGRRARRELAKAAPAPEAPEEEAPETKQSAGQAAYERLDPQFKRRLAPRKD